MGNEPSPLRPAAHPNWLEWWAFVMAIGVLLLALCACFAAAALLGEFLATLTGIVEPSTGRVGLPIVVGLLYLQAAWWRWRR